MITRIISGLGSEFVKLISSIYSAVLASTFLYIALLMNGQIITVLCFAASIVLLFVLFASPALRLFDVFLGALLALCILPLFLFLTCKACVNFFLFGPLELSVLLAVILGGAALSELFPNRSGILIFCLIPFAICLSLSARMPLTEGWPVLAALACCILPGLHIIPRIIRKYVLRPWLEKAH